MLFGDVATLTDNTLEFRRHHKNGRKNGLSVNVETKLHRLHNGLHKICTMGDLNNEKKSVNDKKNQNFKKLSIEKSTKCAGLIRNLFYDKSL